MGIKSLIGHLNKSDVGKIYWHNFCAQFRANLLDEGIARQVFQLASVNDAYRREVDAHARSAGTYDLADIARQAIYFASSENMYALSASRLRPKLTELPKFVSTVISDNTFEAYCAKNVPGLSKLFIGVLTKAGASPVRRGHGFRELFSEMRARKITRINDLPGAAKNILPHIAIRTRYARFWLAGDPTDFPNDPDSVRDLFGLGYLKKGDWLIRISMPTTALFSELGKNAELIRRPSAFCVNDDVAPRFRGITADDHAKPPASPLKRHGTTVHLDRVENAQLPDDGEQEWICPQVAVRQANIDFDLLGEIKADRHAPSNADFRKYLTKTLPLAKADEATVINALTRM